MIAAVGMLSEEEEHFLQKKGPRRDGLQQNWFWACATSMTCC